MQNRHVLITGGTGGLGMGVTPTVLAQGVAAITIPFRQPKEMERLQSILHPGDLAKTRFVKTNLLDDSAVEQLVDSMERVDVLIHLVGGFSMGATHEYSFEQWQREIDLNLNMAFLVCKYSLKRMLKTGYGRIVTLGSRAAVQPGGQLAAYSASKAGLVALTQAIADETKGTQITANVVLPSAIDTPSNRISMGEAEADKWVKPESLAQVICFLASTAAQDLRGAVIPVYGSI